jgi:hypothetical protein
VSAPAISRCPFERKRALEGRTSFNVCGISLSRPE